MSKFHMLFMAVVFVLCMTMPSFSSAAIADGTYSVNYQVNKPNDTSASMANDYFVKPATLTVKDGQMLMQLTIKSSTWVTEFNPPGGATVVSENAATNERIVQFPVERADIVTIPMKIDIDDIDYHHAYSVDFVFESADLPEATASQQEEAKPATTTSEQKQHVAETSAADEKIAAANEGTASSSTTQQSEAVVTQQQAVEVQQPTAVTESNEAVSTAAQEQNPATSDHLPWLYGMLFLVAAFVFMRSTKRKEI